MNNLSEKDSLENRVRVRVFPEMIVQIETVMAENPDRWDSLSHFFRASAAHFLSFIQDGGLDDSDDKRGVKDDS